MVNTSCAAGVVVFFGVRCRRNASKVYFSLYRFKISLVRARAVVSVNESQLELSYKTGYGELVDVCANCVPMYAITPKRVDLV